MTQIHLQGHIPETLDGARLDSALAELFSEYSRSQIQAWIRAGQVTLDGSVQKRPRDKVRANQAVDIHAELIIRTSWKAQDIPLEIIYEDEALIVINKPAGLIVHPGAGNPDQTLLNALLHHAPELAKLPRAGIIHRLDKETTGLLVIARTLTAHHHLVNAMQQRQISRTYEAIVHGHLISGGQIDAPIGRHPTQRTRMSVVTSGKEAITHYRIIERFPAYTHLKVNLETGRTHQIRVHFAHIKHPLVGDPLYGKRRILSAKLSPALKEILLHFPRQALHAQQLELLHPITEKSIRWEAPLPNDMIELIHALQRDAHEKI